MVLSEIRTGCIRLPDLSVLWYCTAQLGLVRCYILPSLDTLAGRVRQPEEMRDRLKRRNSLIFHTGN